MTSRPKYNQYLTSNRRQVPAGERRCKGKHLTRLKSKHGLDTFRVSACVRVCSCVYACMRKFANIHACMYVCLCECARVCIRAHMRPCSGLYVHLHMLQVIPYSFFFLFSNFLFLTSYFYECAYMFVRVYESE